MHQDQWGKIQAIFEAAVVLAPDRRAAYLDSACKNQPALLREVNSLLDADTHADGLLDRLADQAFETPAPGVASDQQVGPYRILEQLGSGGMGVVYKAIDSRLDRHVALKFLPPHFSTSASAKQRFMVEAKAASTLDHANICTVYDIGETKDGQLYIAMAFYKGQNLGQRLANGPLPLGDALSIGIQICKGLAAAHGKGIIHRDIKPANVIITHDHQVKIVDFGIAKMTGVDITGTGDKLGSVAYMSPEQCKGETVDQRTDIWSLGVVLYEILSGKRPFPGRHTPEIMHSILNTTPRALSQLISDIPAGVDQLVNRCIAKIPQERYSDTVGLLSELCNLQQRSAYGVSMQNSAISESPVYQSSSLSSAPTKGQAERRQVTILHCVVYVSHTHSQTLDPELLMEVLPSFKDICRKVIARYEGQHAESHGNDVVVYFGYPYAHEDDAPRAVRTGIGIIEAVTKLHDRLNSEENISLNVRVGVHTGVVVVEDLRRDLEGNSISIIGQAPKIANWLHSLAGPDSLVISAATYDLIQGFFECKKIGDHTFNPAGSVIPVYQVTHESGARSRLDVGALSGLTPLVGRTQEKVLLFDRWGQVLQGQGQCVLIGGEPGIGKSRIVQELKEHVANNPRSWLTECYCSPYYQNSALYPIIKQLEQVVLQFHRNDSADDRLNKLEGFLTQYGLSLPDVVPLFASLLSLPLNKRYKPLESSPERQRQKTLEVLISILLQRSSDQPLLLVVEDLHWADPTTLELINMIIDQGPTAAILTVLTFRPSFSPPWGIRSHLHHLGLTHLGHSQAEHMICNITGAENLPNEVQTEIISKADGVPLFIEELTKTVLELDLFSVKGETTSQNQLAGALTIPATLQDSLTARLDHLGEAKSLAHLGAILGREFSYDLLHAVSSDDEKGLQHKLQVLIKAELIYQRGLPPQSTYIFKHALIQEAAYNSLLKRVRRQHHRHIAEILEQKFPETAETQPELLAHHYTEAENGKSAVAYWLRAGQQALQRSANIEAVSRLNIGLDVVKTIKESDERNRLELNLLTTLGPALIATKGFGAPEVGDVYSRARVLYKKMEGEVDLFPAVWGQWVFHLVRAELATANALATQMLQMSKTTKDSAMQVEAHWTLGDTLFWQGDLTSARTHLEQAVKLYQQERHHKNAYLYGQDPGVSALCYLAFTLWFLGFPEQAAKRCLQAVELARQLAHPFTMGWALGCTALLTQWQGDAEVCYTAANEVIEFCTEQVHPFWLTAGLQIRGWAMVQRGELDEGIAQVQEGLVGYQAIGSEVVQAHFMGAMAECLGLCAKSSEGLSMIEEALAKSQKHGENVSKINLFRIKGNLLLALGNKGEKEAESNFMSAIEMARSHHAKSRELQAVMDLSRLWHSQGKNKQSQQILNRCYKTFTEGFDEPHLKHARALLDSFQ